MKPGKGDFMKKALLATFILFGFHANATGLTDANITEIMSTANEGEIDASKLAQKKADNSEIKDFAKKMVNEHQKSKQDVKDLAKKEKLDMDESTESEKLEKDVKSKISDLKKQKKSDFDRAYIASQIQMHEALLESLTSTYIPTAQNAELKKYLEETKEHVSAHLDEAKSLETKLQ